MATVNNALVTWNDLATMGLTAIGTPPTGLGVANKAELIAAYYVDEAASPFSTYTADRCPPYQTIQNTTTTTTTAAITWICPGAMPCVAYNTEAECNSSGCLTCVQGVCPP